jgi:hypothetical protein
MELGSALLGGQSLLRRLFVEPERPTVAVEVRRRAVGLVRVVREGRGYALGTAAALELPAGTVELSMTRPNLADPAAFRNVLRSVLQRAGFAGGGRICLVLPDPVARVALVPAAEVKGKRRADVDEMIRFRLRKAVPFDVREARVGFVRLGVRADDQVLVAAVYRPVLEGYEEACASLGLQPGIVELSGLSVLAASADGDPGGDRLVVNWDDGYVSLFLVRDGQLVLVRTLAGDTAAAPEQVSRELTNTDIYYRERLGGAGFADVVVRSAYLPAGEAVALVGSALETVARPLDAWGGLSGDYGPVAHALAGAAAAAARRAA